MEEYLKNMQSFLISKPQIITDIKIIQELDKQPLFITPCEDYETYDQNLLRDEVFKKSEKAIGQHSPISVAVWDDDPNKDSTNSAERVNLRIIDGRHRYEEDPNWRRQYYYVDSIEQYWKYRLNIDIKKVENPHEKRVVFEMIGRHLNKQGCPLKDIGKTICKMYPEIPPQSILRYLPQDMKDISKALNRLGKFKETDRKSEKEKIHQQLVSQKEQEIKKLQNELTESLKVNLELKVHLALQEDLIGKYSSRLRILENAEQEVEVEGVGKLKIKLEKDGIKYNVSKKT